MQTISSSYLDISKTPDICHQGNMALSFTKWLQLYFVKTDPVFSKLEKNIYFPFIIFLFPLSIYWFKFCNFHLVYMWFLKFR